MVVSEPAEDFLVMQLYDCRIIAVGFSRDNNGVVRTTLVRAGRGAHPTIRDDKDGAWYALLVRHLAQGRQRYTPYDAIPCARSGDRA